MARTPLPAPKRPARPVVPLTTDALREAFRQRMLVVAGVLGVEVPSADPAAEVLDAVARHVRERDLVDELWLLHIGITGAFPRTDELEVLRRKLMLSSPATAMLAALEATIELQSRTHSGLRTIEIAEGEVLVDVDFCARYEHNTGIQRVVRKTVPQWQGDDDRAHRLVAWTQDSTGYRALSEVEEDRVLHWDDRRFEKSVDKPWSDAELELEHIVIPWRSTILIAEVPAYHLCNHLAAIAESSGNRMVLIGYDAIPLVSASTLPDLESERFAHYLTVIKHADLVAGISRSAADEFAGFVKTLPSQGLTGPDVIEVSLATEVSESAKAAIDAAADPTEKLVLCVGSHEPRKNQDAVLFAAERLFRQGHEFRMVFVGGGSRTATHRFDRRVAALKREGMNVDSYRGMSDHDLWSLFAQARFTVFVSLHEGFGLPVAESVALGTPVLTSDFGSLDEVAAAGGCLQVDPHDDEAILAGMSTLLLDDTVIERLQGEIAGITQKTWHDYADELWRVTVPSREAVR
ncbi:glycosyltransferase [Frondihabitans australicus]|uniref:Glycosyltransferase involved in cell wall biosynthesis n=1 Tax=Frondihabitans australicus TaxID=386892 RepID=A0A495IB67_9MICO|nr:glycosyltransferase [Frondihabitans australicus]RKR73247.1 glycosyltransferase involved in cell wall biosynthesis [Frondihabitans australicus]